MSVFEISSVFCSVIFEFELLAVGSSIIVSVLLVWTGGDVTLDTSGDGNVGEFRCCCCCSNSYSLSKRFLSGCALFDEADVTGDTDADIGDVTIGGVLLLVLIFVELGFGLFRLDGWSTLIVNGESYWISAVGDDSA